MHELSIAQEIIEIIGQSVPVGQKHLIKSVRVEIGKFSNVLPDSLKFCYEACINDTEMQNSTMLIEEIPLKIKCNNCHVETVVDDFMFLCPECGNTDITILEGQELNVTEIELFDNIEEAV
ncbi:MAG: hydrogenase maturation nickel metallochaperone HypA [FCB group bacterium]|jgi:hydrogenase nickel incorporation protein HypA/HybF